jgi:basic membrane protein A
MLTLALAAGAASASQRRAFSACLVTDARSVGDEAIARSAETGLAAAEPLGVDGRVVRSRSTATDLEALRSCVLGGADVTIGLGYLMEAAVNSVATSYPRHQFVIVDASVTMLPSRPANVQGVLFRTEQAGYLVGYAAGLWTKDQGGKAVGAVGSLKIPPVDRYIAGFQAGATKAFPGVKTFHAYAQSVTRESKCRSAALSQIADGSFVELDVAGSCGLGVLGAARAKGVFAIGSDSDQSGHGSVVMTSAVKHVDVAVRSAVLSARSGLLKTGRNVVLGARDGGIGYGTWSPLVSSRIRAAVARQLRLLRRGAVTGIPTTLD